MNHQVKIIWCAIIGFMLMVVARVLAQTNFVPVITPLPPDSESNIVYAMIRQVLNNPASLLVIAFLCVMDWLADDLPFINSRYVAHLSVIFGGCIYWMFAGTPSVPSSFPYPYVVLAVNGVICGFVAFIIHRQAVARFINFIRVRGGIEDACNPPTQLKPSSDETAIFVKPTEKTP